MQTEKEYLKERHILCLRSESVGEYSLPDYNTDVKKVLLINPAAIPSGKFLGDGSIEFSGVVNYDIVYLDSENNVTHAEFTTDYDIAVRSSSEKYIDSEIETAVSGYNVRLVGPRKFSAKCSLESDVHISERDSICVEGDAFESFTPEVITEKVNVMASAFLHGEERELAEEMFSLEGAIVDDIEILMNTAEPRIASVTLEDGRVTVKGDIEISLLFKNADGGLERITKCLAYNEALDAPELTADSELIADVRILSVKTNVNPTELGVSVVTSVICEPHILSHKNEALELVTDGYVKERGTVSKHGDFSYSSLCSCLSDEFMFETACSLSELSCENVESILTVTSHPHIENVSFDGERLKIGGEIRFSAIACQVNEDDMRLYAPIKFSSPFERFVNINCQNSDNLSVKVKMDVNNEKAECINDVVNICASVKLRLTVMCEEKASCLLSSYLSDEEYTHDASAITVYYPSSDETLFSVAKKFHTSMAAIAGDNALTESVFASPSSPLKTLGTKKLIIK